jgi:hypothetical protein
MEMIVRATWKGNHIAAASHPLSCKIGFTIHPMALMNELQNSGGSEIVEYLKEGL